MTPNTITDPQELALMQAVLMLADKNRDDDSFTRELDKSVDALRSYRAKSSSPEPARCEPPEEFKWETQHWLRHGESFRAWWWTGGHWHAFNDDTDHTAEQVAAWGWRYHSVARPCLPDTRPSDTEVEQTAKWTCAALKQSLPEPADCDWPFCGCDEHASKVISALEECGALKDRSEVAEQVHPTETRIQPTDEAVENLAIAIRTKIHEDHYASESVGSWVDGDLDDRGLARFILAHFSTPTQTVTPVEPEMATIDILELAGPDLRGEHPTYVRDESILKFARALLARHLPTSISNSTLDHIQSIAKTREPEQFRNECRDMLRGGG